MACRWPVLLLQLLASFCHCSDLRAGAEKNSRTKELRQSSTEEQLLQLGIQNTTGKIRVGEDLYDVLDPALPAALNRLYLTALAVIKERVAPEQQGVVRSTIATRIRHFVDLKVVPFYNLQKQCRNSLIKPIECFKSIPEVLRELSEQAEDALAAEMQYQESQPLPVNSAAIPPFWEVDQGAGGELMMTGIQLIAEQSTEATNCSTLSTVPTECLPNSNEAASPNDSNENNSTLDAEAASLDKPQNIFKNKMIILMVSLAFLVGIVIGYLAHKLIKRRERRFPCDIDDLDREHLLRLEPRESQGYERSLNRLLTEGTASVQEQAPQDIAVDYVSKEPLDTYSSYGRVKPEASRQESGK